MSDEGPVAVDLFAGAGGFSTGMIQAGFTIKTAIDNDIAAAETYRHNHTQATDVFVVDIRSISCQDVGLQPGDVDVIVGGPPCPTFSSVGKVKLDSLKDRSPTADERHLLYEEFLRFVGELEPSVFVMENVPQMRNAQNEAGENVAHQIREQMQQLGYTVEVQFPDAADFGVPQNRVRTIFLGTRDRSSIPHINHWATHREPLDDSEKRIVTRKDLRGTYSTRQSTLTSSTGSSEPVPKIPWCGPSFERDKGSKQPWITVGEAILDLPPVTPNGTTPPKRATEYRLEPLTDYQMWARESCQKDNDGITNHESRGHNMDDLSLYKILGSGVGWKINEIDDSFQPYSTDKFGDNYRKQVPTSPATTILAHIHKDGHKYIHPREARSLTVREAARLQSFKDSFHFPVSRTQAYKQVGNAVPPLLAEAIGTMIREELI